jgi:hypothetical protein
MLSLVLFHHHHPDRVLNATTLSLQDCRTYFIICYVRNIALLCKQSIQCFLVLIPYIPVAPTTTRITKHFMLDIVRISVLSFIF